MKKMFEEKQGLLTMIVAVVIGLVTVVLLTIAVEKQAEIDRSLGSSNEYVKMSGQQKETQEQSPKTETGPSDAITVEKSELDQAKPQYVPEDSSTSTAEQPAAETMAASTAETATSAAEAEPAAETAVPEPAAEPEPVAEPELTVQAPSITHSDSDTYLPDFMAYCNNTLRLRDTENFSASTCMYYRMDSNQKVVEDYVNLLDSSYNFQLRTVERTSDLNIYDYGFVYTGSGSVETFDADGGMRDNRGLAVHILFMGLSDTYEVQIRYADGIDYVDTGDRTSYQLAQLDPNANSGSGSSSTASGGSSSGSSGTYMIPCPKVGCNNGQVTCSTCGGTGKEKSSVVSTPNYSGKSGGTSTSTTKTCHTCNGKGTVECSTCHGKGQIPKN